MRLVEEEVAARVRSIVQSSEHGSVVEVAALQSENARLKNDLRTHDDGASELRAQLVADVERLRKQVDTQRHAHAKHTDKLREQLKQMGALMEEREIIIAEERQAFESELALAKEVSAQKELALRRQIDELNEHAEALTNTLSMQPLVEDPLLAEGSQGSEGEVGEVKTVASVEKAFAQRMRSVLKMKEQSEARLLSERQQLLEQVQEADATRAEHERLRERDWTARLSEKEKMIELWETREQTLQEENTALKQKLDKVVEMSTTKEATLVDQIKRLTSDLDAQLQLEQARLGKDTEKSSTTNESGGKVTQRVVLGASDARATRQAGGADG